MSTLPISIRSDADTCTFCPKLCRFSCPVAEGEARETVTPWGLMSLLRLVDEGHVELTAEVGETFFHCAGCLRCQTWCRHDNDLPTAMRHARRQVVDSGLSVPRPLQGMELVMDKHGAPFGPVPSLADAAGEVFDGSAEVAYFPGCSRRSEDPEGVLMVGRLLAEVLGRPVALFQGEEASPMHCCGGSLEQAGYGARAEVWRTRMAGLLGQFELVVTECGEFPAFDDGPRTQSLIELLYDRLTDWMPKVTPRDEDRALVLHDGCRTGRRNQGHEATRAIVAAAAGRAPEDMWLARDEALCCGAGDHYPKVSPEGAQVAAGLVLDAVRDQDGSVLVTGSSRCACHLRASGGEGLEIIDVARIVARSLGV